MLKSAALLAIVLVTAGCGSVQKASAPKLDAAGRYLVYERLTGEKGVWIADANGSHPRLLVRDGAEPAISPDGKQVAYVPQCGQGDSCPGTYVVPTSGGRPRRVSSDWRVEPPFTWSPDSKRIVVIRETFSETTLVTIDVVSGKESKLAKTLAEGEFWGWSFSPDGRQIVYARADHVYEDSGDIGYAVDLFIINSKGGEPKRITATGDSGDPIWGPHSIAFSRLFGRNEIEQIQPDGSGRKRITDLPDHVPGNGFIDLTPVGWSDNGRDLARRPICAGLHGTVPRREG
ncbi:MAG TPA: hypothetical protein VK488_03290 [Gaiellaceae bacterium]|nr:hypothetical protein [Gaiellaceae bacterium]